MDEARSKTMPDEIGAKGISGQRENNREDFPVNIPEFREGAIHW